MPGMDDVEKLRTILLDGGEDEVHLLWMNNVVECETNNERLIIDLLIELVEKEQTVDKSDLVIIPCFLKDTLLIRLFCGNEKRLLLFLDFLETSTNITPVTPLPF